ncbi:MAG: TonB-dependent receptor [Parasphingorhabdus sp.]|uniref:TonB-dependent siderophore receptor n=1 Tax=Parasphingorhabdus sp. TaxID=2709688 RepID=UPI0030018F31
MILISEFYIGAGESPTRLCIGSPLPMCSPPWTGAQRRVPVIFQRRNPQACSRGPTTPMGDIVRSLIRFTLLCSPMILAPAVAAAEELGSADASERPDIIVTARKDGDGQNQMAGNGALGAKKLLDTPYSITVVNQEEISKRQATTIAQIFVNDPSVFSFATGGTTNWWGTQIRGLGVRNYYIDDVPLLLYWGGDFPLESVESVEALKGLTGFMHGFGAPGGAISYQTKRPTVEPLLTTEVGLRGKGVLSGHLDAGAPLTDDGKLGYRINIAGEKGTAYNEAGVNRWLGSLALNYTFSPSLKWQATATYEQSKLEHEPFQIYWSSYSGSILPTPTYNYKNLNVDNSFYRTRTLAIATGLDWEFAEGWNTKLNYGYTRKLHNSNKFFVDILNQSGDYQGAIYHFADLEESHFSQLMVQGGFNTGPVKHDIVAGMSYMANPSKFGSDDYYWGDGIVGNIHERQTFHITNQAAFGLEGGPWQDQQRAVFLSDTLHFGEHIQAIVGARYTRYKLLDSDGDPLVDSSYRTSALSPTFALIYKPAAHTSVYGSYVESMEGGARVGGDYANFGDVLSATVSKQVEFGLKYENQGLSLTAAGFRVERANQIDQYIDGQRYLTQDGLTVYKGVEAIGSYQVDKNLRLGGGIIYLDPSIENVSVDNEAILGNVPGEAAKWQLVGNADYSIPAVQGLSIHGNVRYFGKAPTDDYNALYIPGRTLANVGFRYDTELSGQRVAFTGNINNVFNKKYWGLSNIGEGINGSLSAKIYW